MSQETPPVEWLSVKEAAELLGVSRGTVRNLTADGHLPAMRLPSGYRRYKRADVDRFISDRTRAAS